MKEPGHFLSATGSLSGSMKTETMHFKMPVLRGETVNWYKQKHILKFLPLISLFSSTVIKPPEILVGFWQCV